MTVTQLLRCSRGATCCRRRSSSPSTTDSVLSDQRPRRHAAPRIVSTLTRRRFMGDGQAPGTTAPATRCCVERACEVARQGVEVGATP